MLKFRLFVQRNKESIFLCASGFIEMYLATLGTTIKYSLHIHHPSFMSFNEKDKYSIFQKRYFNFFLKSNFGASRFKKIKEEMNLLHHLYINLRSIFSILSIKKSKQNFVLSEYTRREKKILFGVDSFVVCGALDDNSFSKKLKISGINKNHKKPLILTILIDENKRIDELLKAFQSFLDSYPDAHLLIGGRGPAQESLELLCFDLEISKSVEFLGFIAEEDLLSIYASADLFVSIDWADYRITMYEALLANTRVLISNETDHDPFLVESGYLSLCTPKASSCHLAMLKAFESSPSISEDELKTYLRKFTWNNYCRTIAEALTSS